MTDEIHQTVVVVYSRRRKKKSQDQERLVRRRNHYHYLTEFERGNALRLREAGCSLRFITERLVGMYPHCWKQCSRDGTASRRPSYGGPRGTTEREDRRILRTTVAHHIASAPEIRAAVGTTLEQRTVRNGLFHRQLRTRWPVPRITPTPNHSRLGYFHIL
ncbi:uncharacterized protein TNCV_5081121 [Trichonephila clavipes]|nr:uncharacterized protein TNCV_5081121 [Trichonephila clavipes]